MIDKIQEEKMLKIASFKGMDVYQIKTDRFKTNTINIFFHDVLNKENAAQNALLPAILRRGSKKYPTLQEIALYLEELYGAIFDCGVAKKGENQIIQFYMEFVDDKYTADNLGLFERTFELLLEIITKPELKDGFLKAEYFEQEKENLKNLIESRVNDKVPYVVERCYEEMCKEEPFGIYEYGSVKDLSAITLKDITNHHSYLMESLPISVFFTGNVDDAQIKWALEKLSIFKRDSVNKIKGDIIEHEIREVKNVTEKMSVNQAKLSLGFRTNTAAGDKDYYTLLVYNGILGGGMHSKLFQNVREKESLAYYVFSRLEKFKGLMVISSGIEMQNKDKTIEIIMQQLDKLKAGKISDYEFEATIKTIETGIKSLQDSQMQVVDYYLSQSLANTNDTFDNLIENIKNVSKEDVVKVAKKIKLDTIYFLSGE